MKLIIDNQSDLTMEEALEYVLTVVQQGKISNNGKQYCYVTTFKKSEIVVVSYLNKKSERLLVYRENN